MEILIKIGYALGLGVFMYAISNSIANLLPFLTVFIDGFYLVFNFLGYSYAPMVAFTSTLFVASAFSIVRLIRNFIG